MKVIVKLVILGLALVAVFNYVVYQKSGNIPARNWAENIHRTFNKFQNNDASANEIKTVKVSKWADAKGVVHYENRAVEGAKTLEVDPDTNVLPPAPIVELPESKEKSKPKTMEEEMQELRDAKHAQMDAIINR